MKKFFVLCVLLIAVAAAGFVYFKKETVKLPEGISIKNIRNISEQWIKKLDNGWYTQCYDETSPYLQEQVNPQQWLNNMNTYRKPLGMPERRTEVNIYYEQDLPNSPKGEYILVQYATVFAKTSVMIESVVLMKEADGSWKVAGYFIR